MSFSTLARPARILQLHNQHLQSSFNRAYSANKAPIFGITNPRHQLRSPAIGGFIHSSFKRGYATYNASTTEEKSRKMLIYLSGLVVAMVGASYAAVPLYRRFCQATGYGGTVQLRETVEDKIAQHTKEGTVTQREIVVQFNADVADGMQWKFISTQREVRVKPGESALAFYTAENKSSTPITGESTYNVTPMKAILHHFVSKKLIVSRDSVKDGEWMVDASEDSAFQIDLRLMF
ncbi:cytochrome c oxidase assembly protein CtaG / Cox11 family [Euphorbia peplus]|nr:cytochrome c oxidase assembly protein CtaG / Cox11 family [Euphorbia peplus]